MERDLEISLDEVFKREQDPFTVNDDLVTAVDRVRFQRFDDVCEQVSDSRGWTTIAHIT